VRVILGAVAAVLLAGACSGDEGADPAPRPEVTSSTVPVDRSGIVLAPVGGVTTTSVVERGSARLVGVVRGPSGPVAGATVRIERFAADREVRTAVVTGPDGRFVLEGVPGGRYRVRAFQAPRYVQLEAEVRFLADRAEHEFDLVVEEQGEIVVRASAAPSPAVVGFPVNVVVQVAQRAVDGEGIVRLQPLAGTSVTLTGLGRWTLRSGGSGFEAPGRTDSGGTARWELQCDDPGDPGLAVRIPVLRAGTAAPVDPVSPGATSPSPTTTTETIGLGLPSCVAAGPTTTSTTGGSEATTSTTGDGDG